MEKEYQNLQPLLNKDFRAKEYFEELSFSMKEKLNRNAERIKSYDELRNYTERLLNSNQKG